jgi:hypothetical protein
MKSLVPLVLLFLITDCKPAPKAETSPISSGNGEITKPAFPEQLTAVFDAHGGLARWRSMKTLIFEIPATAREASGEIHTVDLPSRKDKIVMGDIEMGFDGKAVWALDPQNTYKGDPMFYHNLMFYFFAMPFVLGDHGIHYGHTDPLVYEGKSYPGLRIGYGEGVGTSPKDEYFIHYDPDTYQMAWLGYTVTYRSGEKSDNVKWIRYNDWSTTNGLLLPKSITWRDYEGRKIKGAKSTTRFNNVDISDQAMPKDFYGMPINAKIVEKP